uniref:Phosphatidic acid phosphatase type 2/haloperoxidase domain-containing protein n=1 Tax=Strigamia maritima TaxID=126957 RepID=T1JH74_STRMM
KSELIEPFQRKIQNEELWLYKNPRTPSYVPVAILWICKLKDYPFVIFVPLFFITVYGITKRDKSDSLQAVLAVSLTLCLNGVLTNVIKLVVGRPRPDFFWRCFPDGFVNSEMNCTGNILEIANGRKSFPSGHSISFASMGFTTFYLAGKLYCFNFKGRGQSWRLCCALFPLCAALMIALSRTADYHHHWQGSMFYVVLFLAWELLMFVTINIIHLYTIYIQNDHLYHAHFHIQDIIIINFYYFFLQHFSIFFYNVY